MYFASGDGNLYAVNVANSNASSEGSRVLLGTLGQNNRYNPAAPAAALTSGDTQRSTPTPEPTPTPTLEPADPDRATPTDEPKRPPSTTAGASVGETQSDSGGTQTPTQDVQGFAGQLFASLIGTELLVAVGTAVVVVLLVVTWSREVEN